MSSLPPEILAMVEMHPIEDLLLAVLRPKLTGISVQTLVADDQAFPFVLARRSGDWGEWSGDPRFLDAGQVTIEVFCEGIEADSDAAKLSEAVRVSMYASLNEVVAGKGHLRRVRMTSAPRRAPDWATSTGPVQYADLPAGTIRYESIYQVEIRKPSTP